MTIRGNPKVSVIIPAFNRAATIRRSIESVLHQTFEDFEIIVVDDGSSDGTREVATGLDDRRIGLLCHASNRGPAAARNTGIREAAGEYLAFLDSDDAWLPDKLRKQIDILDNLPPNWGMSCTAHYLVTDHSKQLVSRQVPNDLFKHLLGTCDLSPGSTLMLRKACVNEVGFIDEEFERLEDWDWLLRLSGRYRLAYIPEPQALIWKDRLPSAQISERSTLRFLGKHDKDIRECGLIQRRRILSRHFLRLSYYFYSEKKVTEGNRYFLRAVSLNPLQNPFRFAGALLSMLDGLIGTRVATQAILLKRRFLKR